MTPTAVAKHAVRLSELAPGQSGRVLRVHGHGPHGHGHGHGPHGSAPHGLRQRLLDMGVTRGAEVRVLRRAPLGDPIEFAIGGYCLALRASEADLVELEPMVVAE